MPTPVFGTGWEHGVVITGATPVPNDRIWHTVVTTGGAPIVTTTTPRSGARCMECPATSAAAAYVGRNVSALGEAVAGFFVRFVGSLPTADCKIFTFAPAAGSFCDVRFHVADSTLRARVGATASAAGVVVAPDTWYRVDCVADVGSGTRTMTVQVDGTEVSATEAVAASTISSFRIGKNTDTTVANGQMRFDDLVVSGTLADYPLGDHEVLVMRPNADGTHSFTATRFGYDDAGADILVTATDVWTRLDDTTIETIGTTDSIRQKTDAATEYVEVAFDPAPRSVDAWAVEVLSSHDGSTTGANSEFMKWNDGGTILDIYSNAPTGADFSNTTVTFNSSHRATAPSGGAWTQAKLDGIRIRWGYMTLQPGLAILHGLMLEVVYPVTAALTPTFPFSRRDRRIIPLI